MGFDTIGKTWVCSRRILRLKEVKNGVLFKSIETV